MSALLWLPSLLPLAITALNVATWRRIRPGARPLGRVSALVPARNEAARIDACLAALVATDADEILVLDDASEDDTADRVRAWAGRDARVRLLRGAGPPPGWLGKPAACEALARAATGDRLLFVDADVEVAPDVLRRLGPVDADLVTALPRQRMPTLGERLVLPLLHVTATAWLPLALVPRSRHPAVLAACGQVVLVRRDALARIGGFGAVRASVVDDLALARTARRAGLRVDFVDGTDLATCRMYGSFREAVDGFSKNLYPGVGGTPPALVGVVVLYVATMLAPWIAAAFVPAAWTGIAANLLQRLLLAVRFRQPPITVLLHPIQVLVFVGIALRSAWWTHTRTAVWRGRAVPA